MRILSEGFAEGEAIPPRYTCDGDDVSPPLAWVDVPDGARTIALVAEDPDAPAGTYVHWVAFNLPATSAGLAAGASGDGALPDGALEGSNSWGRVGYGGPCPPSGTHRYFFRLRALDAPLRLRRGASAAEVVRATDGHVLAEAVLGRYARR